MPTQRLTVSVPKPCQEDWSAMTPHGQGKFCGSCQKTVVDFTAMTDAQVFSWLSRQKGETCGRFRENQLDRELAAVSLPARKWAWRAVLLGITAWLSSKTAEAQVVTTGGIEIIQSNQPSKLPYLPSPQSALNSISGIVLDSASLQPMPGVTVLLSGTTKAVSADMHGEFEISVPDSLISNQALQISFIGYLTETVHFKDLNGRKGNKILLRPDRTAVTEVVIVAGAVAIVKNPPVQPNKKQPSFFQRLKEKLF